MTSERHLTGVLRDVRRCYINDTGISFLFGYIVEHKSAQYKSGDWFASSYITDVRIIGGRYCFYTANSVYMADNYASIIVSDASIDNIRMGTPPEVATNMDGRAIELVALLGLTRRVVCWAQDYALGIDEVISAIDEKAHLLFSEDSDDSTKL